MSLSLSIILINERNRRNQQYPRLVRAGQMTSEEANRRWARFNTLLPEANIGTDMARRFYTTREEAIEEYRRWISELSDEQQPNYANIGVLKNWIDSLEFPPKSGPAPSAQQTSLF